MRLLAVLLLCAAGLAGSTSPASLAPEAVPHDAYIWQRNWTPAVIEAARRSADIVRAWRVLAAESDHLGRWTRVAVPWDELRATGRPIIAVMRIDGRLDEARLPSLLEQAATVPESVAGIEIDYDCPTPKLAAYAAFLAELRRRLPASVALSITALPTWMNSPDLRRLATDEVAETVLQVHAVDDPHRGLFDPGRAEHWVRAFARRTGRPFRVALPAYDVRVTWRGDGRLAGVEGERPLLLGAAGNGATLAAAPESVLHLLHALERDAPDNWRGVVWFRLPTDADRRAWSPETWRSVVQDRLSPAEVSASLAATASPGLWTVTLSNDGAADGMLPREVRLGPSCILADGANGFRVKAGEEGGALVLETSEGGRLRAHSTHTIGWARCTNPGRSLDVVR
jgi:Protein of unknown function (DUF3142)